MTTEEVSQFQRDIQCAIHARVIDPSMDDDCRRGETPAEWIARVAAARIVGLCEAEVIRRRFAETESSDTPGKTLRELARRISDPGAFTTRSESETVAEWGARAVAMWLFETGMLT